MKGINFIRVRDNGDATTTYNIYPNIKMTVNEFCELILEENPKEWGSVYVGGEKVMEYRYGRGTVMGSFYVYCCRNITSGWANGGWSAMDYHIGVEE